jgi:hypothetical protein
LDQLAAGEGVAPNNQRLQRRERAGVGVDQFLQPTFGGPVFGSADKPPDSI